MTTKEWSKSDAIPHLCHDDVIKWKHFPRYWSFVRGIHWSPVNSPHKGQRRGALMFSLICAWISGLVNNPEAGDLRHHRAHYDVIVMVPLVNIAIAVYPQTWLVPNTVIFAKYHKQPRRASELFPGCVLDSKIHGANMGPTWVLSAPGGPHVGPINLVIRGYGYLAQSLRPGQTSTISVTFFFAFYFIIKINNKIYYRDDDDSDNDDNDDNNDNLCCIQNTLRNMQKSIVHVCTIRGLEKGKKKSNAIVSIKA